MRWSEIFIPTLREDPAGISHPGLRVLVRGGYLRRVKGTDYLYLPLFIRVWEKLIYQLGRALTSAGAGHIGLALDRRYPSGKKDPTIKPVVSPEIICRVVNRELRSYRQLPLVLFHFSRRPIDEAPVAGGGGLISEHDWLEIHLIAASAESLVTTGDRFTMILTDYLERCGLAAILVPGESGVFEIFIPAEKPSRGAAAFSCDNCNYLAAAGTAEGRPTAVSLGEECRSIERIATPGAKTVEEVTAFLGIGAEQLIKTLLYTTGREHIGALVRGDRTVNENKLRRVAGATELRLLNAPEVLALTGAAVGFSGPVGLQDVRLIADREIPLMCNAVVGGNTDDIHLINVNPEDFAISQVANIREVVEGDQCIRCSDGILRRRTGLVVGGIILPAGNDSPEILFDDEGGGESRASVGSIYVDLTALVLAIAEIHQDDRGLIWPEAVTPFQVQLMAVNPDDDRQRMTVARMETELLMANVEVLYDDRRGRVGGKFKDADLLGVPHRVIIGPQGLKKNTLDWENRQTGKIAKLAIPAAVEYIVEYFQQKSDTHVTS
jgi:prolyl-tRNA synthetase